MSEHSTIERHTGAWTAPWITAALLGAAGVGVIFGISLALGREDTEAVESPLMLAVARQLLRGPGELYGPFSRQNPLVLIHAPLYYRISALLAWPLYKAGLDSVLAAMAAGRSLAFLGLAATLAAAYRLARLDGAARSAGLWSALLIASSPVVGVLPYAVRPDMLGVALETTGIFLVMSVWVTGRPGAKILPVAFVAFALAACTKQHFIAAPLVSALFLLIGCLHRQLSFKLVVRSLLAGIVVLFVVYGAEEFATNGRMALAVFRAAAATSSVHPGDWMRVFIVLFAVAGKSSGLVVLWLTAGLAAVAAQPGIGRKTLVVLGIAVTVIIAAQCTMGLTMRAMSQIELAISVLTLATAVCLIIPACYVIAPNALSAGRLDRAIWSYLAVELALVLVLSRMSTGAWTNYGIQPVVLASVLAARALARACANARSLRASVPIALAAAVVLVGTCSNVETTIYRRLYHRYAVWGIIDHFKRPSSEFFFTEHPGDNRVYGRLELVFDDWLYPVFESIHIAEPRSIWLAHALTSDSIRFVVNTSDRLTIDGLGKSLKELGYNPRVQVGPFFVWERSALAGVIPQR
jgi:hypothetical protein